MKGEKIRAGRGELDRTAMRGIGSSFFFFFFFSVLLVSSSVAAAEMAEAVAAGEGSGVAKQEQVAAVHIVYMERPEEGVEAEAHHIGTLSSVLGSEEAAKEALVYSYKTAASGFSAKLTPQQVAEISKQPGVLQVVLSRTVHLHSGPAKLHV